MVSLLRAVKSATSDGLILGTRIHRGRRLEELEEALYDHAFEELDIAPLIVGEPCDLSTSGGEEVLQMLLSTV